MATTAPSIEERLAQLNLTPPNAEWSFGNFDSRTRAQVGGQETGWLRQ